MNRSAAQAFFLLVLLFVFSGLLGALVAPLFFDLMGRKAGFDNFAVNCITFLLFAGSFSILRRYRMDQPSSIGFPGQGKKIQAMVKGTLLGFASVMALYAMGRALHIFLSANPFENHISQKAPNYLGMALLVGILEETLFRGIVFGVLRKNAGFWISASLSSLVFSAVHFLIPASPGDAGGLRWTTGLLLLHRSEFFMAPLDQMVPFCLTLFLMGLALCALYEKYRSLYLAVGLHAGWVWAFKTGPLLFDLNPGRLGSFFGSHENISRSYASFSLSIVFLTAGLWLLMGKLRGKEQ